MPMDLIQAALMGSESLAIPDFNIADITLPSSEPTPPPPPPSAPAPSTSQQPMQTGLMCPDDYKCLSDWMMSNHERVLDIKHAGLSKRWHIEPIQITELNMTRTVGCLVSTPVGTYVMDLDSLMQRNIPYNPSYRFLGCSFDLKTVCPEAANVFLNCVDHLATSMNFPNNPPPQGSTMTHESLVPHEDLDTVKGGPPEPKKRKRPTPKTPKEPRIRQRRQPTPSRRK